MAALEAGDEGPDPRQHIRVQCWGKSFFKSSSVTSSGSGGHAAPDGSPAADTASSNVSGGRDLPAAAGAEDDAAAAIHQQLVSVFRYAAMHCYLRLDEAEQILAHGDAAMAVRGLQVHHPNNPCRDILKMCPGSGARHRCKSMCIHRVPLLLRRQSLRSSPRHLGPTTSYC